MSKADELRAALALAEVEEELVVAKAAGTLDAKLKQKVRAAREAARGTTEN